MVSVNWAAFTPWSALAGGALIGLAATVLAICNGRVAGISGIVAGVLRPVRGDLAWRLAFLAGLAGAAGLAGWISHSAPGAALVVTGPSPVSTPMLVVAGLLVGLGTRYGSGCTSGHGVCGLGRLSPRSLMATLCFMATGFIAVGLVRHLIP